MICHLCDSKEVEVENKFFLESPTYSHSRDIKFKIFVSILLGKLLSHFIKNRKKC